MKKRNIALVTFLALIVVAVVAWNIAYPTHKFRFKVTVNVETPEGVKSGFAVRELVVRQQLEIGDSGPGSFTRGEAVVVDLGERGILFALISESDRFLVFRTFPYKRGGLTRAGMRHYERLEAKADLDPMHYPLLVSFKDINDPKTIEIAYQTFRVSDRGKFKLRGVQDNMRTRFGAGVRLRNITIEMTKEPVTWGVREYLLWLDLYYDQKFSGNRSGAIAVSAPLEEKIGAGYFSTRRNK